VRRDLPVLLGLLAGAIVITLAVAACTDSEEVGQRGSQPSRPTRPTAASPPERAAYHARDLIVGFRRGGLPVGKIRCYDETTDPNQLLGRPGGYTEKCDWADKRAEQLLDDDLVGGSIEVFDTPGLARERAVYLGAFQGPSALNPGWVFIVPDNATHVLRVDQELTKSQADAYRAAMRAQFPPDGPMPPPVNTG
jgi:hypothetical protein